MSTQATLALTILLAGAAAAPALAGGDAAAGALVFRACQACHSTTPGQNGIGPSLAGVFGRAAGAAPGYGYSDAMAGSGVVWDEPSLDAHLADVPGFVPGNRMGAMYPIGVADAQQRADVIAYLKTLGGG